LPNQTRQNVLNIGETLQFPVISSVAAGSKPYGPQDKKLFTS